MLIELNLILNLNFYLKNKKNNSDRQNRTAVRCVLGTCTNHYTISLEVIIIQKYFIQNINTY